MNCGFCGHPGLHVERIPRGAGKLRCTQCPECQRLDREEAEEARRIQEARRIEERP